MTLAPLPSHLWHGTTLSRLGAIRRTGGLACLRFSGDPAAGRSALSLAPGCIHLSEDREQARFFGLASLFQGGTERDGEDGLVLLRIPADRLDPCRLEADLTALAAPYGGRARLDRADPQGSAHPSGWQDSLRLTGCLAYRGGIPFTKRDLARHVDLSLLGDALPSKKAYAEEEARGAPLHALPAPRFAAPLLAPPPVRPAAPQDRAAPLEDIAARLSSVLGTPVAFRSGQARDHAAPSPAPAFSLAEMSLFSAMPDLLVFPDLPGGGNSDPVLQTRIFEALARAPIALSEIHLPDIGRFRAELVFDTPHPLMTFFKPRFRYGLAGTARIAPAPEGGR